MSSLKKEIDLLLSNLEAELLEFVSFIRNMEDDYDCGPKEKNTSETNPFSEEFNLSGSAITDAFKIAENVLLKMSTLLDQFASLPTEEERNLENYGDTYVIKYYALYVYRIASYLIQIIQDHLEKFSAKLNELASPLPSDEDVRADPDKGKSTPVKPDVKPDRKYPARYFKFKPYMPTNKIREQFPFAGCTCSSKSSPERPSRDSKYNQNEYYDHETDRRKLKIDDDAPSTAITDTYDDLIRILKSIHELEQLFRLLQSLIGMPSKRYHNKLLSTFVKKVMDDMGNLYKKKIINDCCTSTCDQCCEVCKRIHKIIQKKEMSKEGKGGSRGCYDIPILTKEPRWIQSDTKQDEPSVPFTDSGIRRVSADIGTQTSRKFNESPTGRKRFSDQCTTHSQESPSFSESLLKLLNKKHEKIVPGKPTTRISSGHLKPAPTPIKREGPKKRPLRERKPLIVGLTSFKARHSLIGKTEDTSEDVDDESQEQEVEPEDDDELDESEAKPLYLKDIKEKIYTPSSAFGGFCLFPGLSSSSRPLREILIQKNSDADLELPREITFDVSKFITLLKEKFKNFLDLEQSSELSDADEEATIVLNIVFDSVGEATRISKEKAEKDLMQEVRNIATQVQMECFTEHPLDEHTQEFPYVYSVHQEKHPDDYLGKSRSEDEFVPLQKSKHRKTFHACRDCLDMIEHPSCQADDDHRCTEKCLLMQSLKTTCFTCMNARERGLTIHQCHDSLPSGVMEVRHMDDTEKISVCYVFWNRRTEQEDWRWQKNPFDDPTRVEIEQQTNLDKNPILKVIFGPEGTMLKESLAETQLLLVCDSAFPKSNLKEIEIERSDEKKPASTSYLYKGYRKSKLAAEFNKMQQQGLGDHDRKLLTKMGRFYDDIQRVGYGKGPPLILKLRRKSALNDAFNVLTVPSNIRLNYYRYLRVLVVSDDSDSVFSSTNFKDEDEINQLFELFEHELFGSGEKRLFVHPSEETQCIYFNTEYQSHPQWFTFAGIVLALAILHQKKLDLKLPICLFKCLLDRALDIDDLKEIDPLAYQQLMWIKSNDIATGHRRMTFTIKENIDNQILESELMQDGSKIAVTQSNKFRYIDLVVKWKLAERCLIQLKDFRSGFASVIDPGFLKHFTEKELRSIIRRPPPDPEMYLKDSSSHKVTKIQRSETC